MGLGFSRLVALRVLAALGGLSGLGREVYLAFRGFKGLGCRAKGLGSPTP